jgi:hypothetical protein
MAGILSLAAFGFLRHFRPKPLGFRSSEMASRAREDDVVLFSVFFLVFFFLVFSF